jgi:hypothetical protein
MEVKELIDKYLTDTSYNCLYIKPDIPEKKLKNAVNSYGQGITFNEVILLIDDTVFGGAKEGLLLTETDIYTKAITENPNNFPLDSISRISIKKKTVTIKVDSSISRSHNCTDEEKSITFSMPETSTLVIVVNLINELVNIKTKESNSESFPTGVKGDLSDSIDEVDVDSQIHAVNNLPVNSIVKPPPLSAKQEEVRFGDKQLYCPNCQKKVSAYGGLGCLGSIIMIILMISGAWIVLVPLLIFWRSPYKCYKCNIELTKGGIFGLYLGS